MTNAFVRRPAATVHVTTTVTVVSPMNLTEFAAMKSWSPEQVAECMHLENIEGVYIEHIVNGKKYRPSVWATTYTHDSATRTYGLAFSEALEMMRHGMRMRREGWTDKSQYMTAHPLNVPQGELPMLLLSRKHHPVQLVSLICTPDVVAKDWMVAPTVVMAETFLPEQPFFEPPSAAHKQAVAEILADHNKGNTTGLPLQRQQPVRSMGECDFSSGLLLDSDGVTLSVKDWEEMQKIGGMDQTETNADELKSMDDILRYKHTLMASGDPKQTSLELYIPATKNLFTGETSMYDEEFEKQLSEQNKSDRAVIERLRKAGYAIILWTLEEVGFADPRKIEAQSIEFLGNLIIDQLHSAAVAERAADAARKNTANSDSISNDHQ